MTEPRSGTQIQVPNVRASRLSPAAVAAAALLLWTTVVVLERLVDVSRSWEGARAGEMPLARVRIDVNTSPLPELTLLPGIGPGRAEAIVLHRVRHGRFPSLDALASVHGLGPGTVDQLRAEALAGR